MHTFQNSLRAVFVCISICDSKDLHLAVTSSSFVMITTLTDFIGFIILLAVASSIPPYRKRNCSPEVPFILHSSCRLREPQFIHKAQYMVSSRLWNYHNIVSVPMTSRAKYKNCCHSCRVLGAEYII